MTANSPPYALQAGSHSAQLFRQAISTLLNSAGGIVDAGDYLVTQNGTPNMSVNVAGGVPGGRIWVPGTSAAGVQGLYYGFNDATVNLAIAASNPSNPRIDVPIAQVQDAAYSGATSSFQLAVVTGTPAGSPVAPSLPASSLALANVAVAANATSVVTANITDKRFPFAAGAGAWQALSLSGTVTSAPTLQVRLEAGGSIARLRGFLQSSSSQSAGFVWGILPAGCRPVAQTSVRVPGANIFASTYLSFGFLSNGNIVCDQAVTSGAGISLEGITFSVAA